MTQKVPLMKHRLKLNIRIFFEKKILKMSFFEGAVLKMYFRGSNFNKCLSSLLIGMAAD